MQGFHSTPSIVVVYKNGGSRRSSIFYAKGTLHQRLSHLAFARIFPRQALRDGQQGGGRNHCGKVFHATPVGECSLLS